MTDVRSLLKNERASRRIQHKHASYSTGSLLCTVCHLQIKSEALWDGHLRSPGHILRLDKLQQHQREQETTASNEPYPSQTNNKKRKASDEDGSVRKKTRPETGIPGGFFDASQPVSEPRAVLPSPTNEIQIPSRPATPIKPPPQELPPKPVAEVDEDEWAAFEADIAAVPDVDNDAVISAPAMTAAELAARSLEESNKQRKERQEAELEGDKEDAARKMEEELEEMESLEQRVKRLREKREELRKKESLVGLNQKQAPSPKPAEPLDEADEDEDEEDDDDDWDGFRMR